MDKSSSEFQLLFSSKPHSTQTQNKLDGLYRKLPDKFLRLPSVFFFHFGSGRMNSGQFICQFPVFQSVQEPRSGMIRTTSYCYDKVSSSLMHWRTIADENLQDDSASLMTHCVNFLSQRMWSFDESLHRLWILLIGIPWYVFVEVYNDWDSIPLRPLSRLSPSSVLDPSVWTVTFVCSVCPHRILVLKFIS